MHFLTLNSTIFHSLLKAIQLLEVGRGIPLSYHCSDKISHFFCLWHVSQTHSHSLNVAHPGKHGLRKIFSTKTRQGNQTPQGSRSPLSAAHQGHPALQPPPHPQRKFTFFDRIFKNIRKNCNVKHVIKVRQTPLQASCVASKQKTLHNYCMHLVQAVAL